MKKWISLLMVFFLTGCGTAAKIESTPVESYISPAADAETGRGYSDELISGQVEEFWQHFSSEYQMTFPMADFKAFYEGSFAPLGKEVATLYELAMPASGLTLYERVVLFSNNPNPMRIQLGINASGEIEIVMVTPPGKTAFAPLNDYTPHNSLRLPFDGEWTVFWGGTSIFQNYHAIDYGQRYAFDFLIQKDGTSFTGDGTINEDYFCFGQPVLAPAAGTVKEVVNDVADNTPGQMNPDQAEGNYVVVNLGRNEVLTLAHFKQGSLKVNKGDQVEAGQVLGLCGNSGNSTEAHIHMHLQSTAFPWINAGIPAVFESYTADGQPQSFAMPVRGQVISPR